MNSGQRGRRTFLSTASRLGAAAALARYASTSRTVLASQTAVTKDRLLIRSARPQDLETPVRLLTDWITPNDLFYVRSHFYTPTIDVNSWTLAVDGDVERPLRLDLAALRQMPRESVTATLECAGNGRAFFDPPVAGVQWEKGAVGNASWTGVRLGDVLQRAGVRSSVRYVWLDGADVPVGTAPEFIRQLPLTRAMDDATLLAYEMNGQSLPVAHGFPLRVIVPGWEGAYSVKWLTHIRASDREHDGFFVQTAYRYPKRPISPGTLVPAADTDALTGLVVKSMLTSPAHGATVPLGTVLISGFAWAGETQVARVEVSTDGGHTWAQARLGNERARYAWRQFSYLWRVTDPGFRVLLSRAVDDRGRAQPIVPPWNPAGYLWNAVDQVHVNVNAT